MKRRPLVLSLFFLALVALPGLVAAAGFDRSNAEANQVLVRIPPSEAARIAEQYGLVILDEIEEGDTSLFLMAGPEPDSGQEIAALLFDDPAVVTREVAGVASLPEIEDGLDGLPASGDIAADLARFGSYSTAVLDAHLPSSAWAGYTDQQATTLVRLHAAHASGLGFQPVTIAFIDTGVDPYHPLLVDALIPGYDFLLERFEIASEWSHLGQSLAVILEDFLTAIQSQTAASVSGGVAGVAPLSASTALVLDQSLAVILEDGMPPPAFGHGTMVAGLLRLMAPHAELMPLKAFDELGQGHIFDVIRAIRFAVDHGADVINMSFSTATPSRELHAAIEYAASQGVLCFAAAGNGAAEVLVYPAAFDEVLGVAATDTADHLSPFSNHGAVVAALAAPGEGLISTYPGGNYAAGWGTSFSTALAAGAAALIQGINEARPALIGGSVAWPWLEPFVEGGRLDALNTMIEAHAGNGADP